MDLGKVRNDWLISRISELSNEMETLYRLYGAEDKQYHAKELHMDKLIEEWLKRTESLGDFKRLKPKSRR